jgi:ADP-ribosylglycohydrolase
MDRGRARGALLGLAVGDALGTTLEFEVRDAPSFPTLATGPHREIVGGGPFGLPPGQVTDDTQMACCIAASLGAHGTFVVEDVARRYVEWHGHAFDVGNQTAAALRAIAAGRDPRTAGRDVWEQNGRRPAGNGSLMRTAAIGVFFAEDLGALRRAARADSEITHFDPRCVEACIAFDAAIASGVASAGDANAMWSAARAEIESAELARDLDLARAEDPDLFSEEVHLHRHQGFVRVAFRLAFWELLHAPSLEAALVDVVNRGGDADTNGAVAGALLGARYGEDAIPARWREPVLAALLDGPASPFRDAWHPRTLLALAG